jgi:hypothetical protein
MTLPKDQEWHWTEGNKYAIEGMKTLLLLNGGSALALLAFFGNRGKVTPNSIDIAHSAGNALLMFGLGALTTGFVFICAYLTQLQYGNGNRAQAVTWHRATYITVALGITLFSFGIFFARAAVILGLTNA